MKNNDPHSHRMPRDPRTAAPFGVSPDGHLIASAEELPTLPIPKRVVVTAEHIDIDGWVFPMAYISKSWLVWFQQTALRWADLDVSKENKLWINGIVEGFEAGLKGEI